MLVYFGAHKVQTFMLPSPLNLSYGWNFGSLLGVCLIIQLVSGLVLSMRYFPDMEGSFVCVVETISRNTDGGFIIRACHSNGASMYFLFMYAHIARGLYYGSFLYTKVWASGCTILLLSMMTAFLGYVLPMGQMSFWGSAVITNLLSEIPLYGKSLVIWIWGGPVVSGVTLNRFFSLHYILPFVISFLSVVHLYFLHSSGSSNPLGFNSSLDKVSFSPFYIWKDLVGIMLFLVVFVYIVFFQSYTLLDPENFIEANPMVTPVHIQPEWYFLFAYAILRSIPSKSGGVLALLLSVLAFYMITLFSLGQLKMKGNSFNPLGQILFIWFLVIFFVLTSLGACPAEGIYLKLGMVYTKNYFVWFFLYFFCLKMWSEEH